MTFCENCGMKIADDAKFCENCGAPHMKAVSQYTSNNDSQAAEQAEQTGQTYGNAYGQPETGNTSSSYESGNSTDSGNTYNTGNAYDMGNSYYTNPTAPARGPLPMMGFMEAVQKCFSNYVNFSGRARRSEYWFYTLFVGLVQLALGIIGNMIFGAPENGGTNILQNLFSLAIFLPSLAVFWRRMHDIGRTGLWFFLNLVPCIGQIVLLVFECTDSQPGENMYGMSPKYPE